MTSASSRWDEFLTGIDAYKGAILYLGTLLKRAKEDYQDIVGEGINSWHDFLAQPEVGLTVREANSLIKLVEWLDDTNTNIDELNLSTARFAANKEMDIRGFEDDACNLSLKDFKEHHHEVKTNDAPQTYDYYIMKRSKETGSLSRVYGVEDLEETIKKRIDE